MSETCRCLRNKTQHGQDLSEQSASKTALLTALLLMMTVAAYLPATQCGFIWDDDAYVQGNQTLRSADGLRQIWFKIGATSQYYPMVHTSYWLEYRFWELNPAGYHVVNILLHVISAVLLWRVLTFLRIRGAWLAAAVFALHPVHVESVAWITERKNVLSGVFYLGALLAYLHYALTPRNKLSHDKSGWLYAASLVLFMCALLSKTVTCTLPAVLLLLLWWKRKRIGWPDMHALVPFFALGIVFGLLTVWMEKHHVGAMGEEWGLSFIERCLVAGRVLCFYVGKLIWPSKLTFIYPRWHIDAAASQQYLYPAIAVGVIAAFWLARRRIGKGPLVAVLCFAGTLFPALGFFDVYPMRYSFVADHFQYLASAALIALVAAVGYRTVARLGGWEKAVAKIAIVSILATLGTLTWQQCRIYKDLETLWRDTLRKNPGAWMAHNNLGIELKLQGKLDEAISHYRRALQAKSDDAGAHNNLANVLQLQGKSDEAISHYRQALQVRPDYVDVHYNLGIALQSQGKLDEAISYYRQALQLKPDHVRAHYNLANALQSQGKLDEAISHYRQVLQVEPDYAEARYNLGVVLQSQDKFDEAISHFRQAVQVKPDYAGAQRSLGDTLLQQGKFEEAIPHFTEAVRLRPDWVEPMNNLAWLLAAHKGTKFHNPEEAIGLAERACELTNYENPSLLDTLAAAYAAADRFSEAVATAEKALKLAPSEQKELANQIRSRLRLYKMGQPYIEPSQTTR